MYTIAIVGRPNVGKSTLFNRLAGKKVAITDNTPGVTRDRQESSGTLGDFKFNMIDTAGYDRKSKDVFIQQAIKQTETAASKCDLAFFVIDARTGITSQDREFASLLRKKDKATIMIANKCEGKISDRVLEECLTLGFGEPVAISAEHNLGMADLHDELGKFYPQEIEEELEEQDLPRISIVGRPNVGKSSLFNTVTGENRVLTSDIAGTTRDTVSLKCAYKGKEFLLEDTAGLRKKSGVIEKIEKQSVAHTLRSIKFANLIIMVIDATQPIEKQDLTIADLVIKEGRALVIAANKWDLVKEQSKVMDELRYKLDQSLSQVKDLPLVFVSAKTGNNMDKLMATCFRIYDLWQSTISTGKLNSWLKGALDANSPPMATGKVIKMRYMTQTGTKPPKFVIFTSNTKDLPDSYLRYLVNSLRSQFDLAGIPLRLTLRKNKNPYKDAPK